MLILTRKPGESIYIGDDVKITLVEIKGNQGRLGIDAPPQYRIYREEIYVLIQEENRQAAAAASDMQIGLAGLPEWKGSGQQDGSKRRGVSQLAGSKGERKPEIVRRRKSKKDND